MSFVLAKEIDLSKINPAMKGVSVRPKPLFDIDQHGKQIGFGLNMKMPNQKRFTASKFAPYLFETEAEANLAAELINEWANND